MARLFLPYLFSENPPVLRPHSSRTLVSEKDTATPFLSAELATYFLNNMFFHTSLLFPPISGLRFSQNDLTDGLPIGQWGE